MGGILRLDRPIDSPDDIEADVAPATAAHALLRAIAAMPDGALALGLTVGTPARLLRVNALVAKFDGDLTLPKAEPGQGLLILAIEVLIIGFRVDPPKNGVPGFASPAIWAQDRADPQHIASPGAFLEAGGMACNDRKRRLIDAARLAVAKPDVRGLQKPTLVFLLEDLEIARHLANDLRIPTGHACHCSLFPFSCFID